MLERNIAASELPKRFAGAADEFLAGLLEQATSGKPRGYALLAVGGYGRGELCPGSDLDVVLVHRRRARYQQVAEKIWYAIWDTGLHLDHSVRTRSEVISMAKNDLRVVLGLLDGRLIAGDAAIAEPLLDQVQELWRSHAGSYLPELRRSVEERHRTYGELAFLLEPDLKQAAGGLRDIGALRSLGRALPVLTPLAYSPAIASADSLITAVRVVVQCRTGSNSDRLALEEQDQVAEVLRFEDADVLMAAVAEAGRNVAAACSEAFRRAQRAVEPRRAEPEVALSSGIVLRAGEVGLEESARPEDDPSLCLKLALVAAQHQVLIETDTLSRLAECCGTPPEPWTEDLREGFIALLSTGDALVTVVEMLDQRHLFELYLPEWRHVRNRPQRNAYHRYTVDRHLLEAVARASEHVARVRRPDLLLMATLLHDIGKGHPGDHSEVGTGIAYTVMTRMGYPEEDVKTVIDLVAFHLVLPEFATRRDLDDPSTATVVARLVGDRDRLELLAALTESDGMATGTAAWGSWKAELVARLVERVGQVLDGAPLHAPAPPTLTPEQEALIDAGKLAILANGRRVSVVAPDRPGLLAAVAGALALNGCNVRRATADEGHNDMAIEVFDIEPAFDHLPDWARVERDLEAALSGAISLEERLTDQDRVYSRGRRPVSAHPALTHVKIDNETSELASIVEVRAPDRLGLLHRITSVMAREHLDVVAALVDTLGHEVIDTFYVRDERGSKLSEPARLEQVRSALESVLARGD